MSRVVTWRGDNEFFGLSVIGMLALLRARQVSMPSMAAAVVVYGAVAVAFTTYLRPL